MKSYTARERLNRYENAQETIGFMMATRTEWIHKEEAKTHPDQARIAQWKAEFVKFHEEMDALDFDDDAAIDHVFRDYSPALKAEFERERAVMTAVA